VQWEAKQ